MEVDTQTHHPNPQPQPHHRKIELQSPLDLTYLQQNLAQTALSKLDLHFPPIPAAPKPATIISLDGSSQDPNSNNPQATLEPTPEIEPDPLRTKVQSLISSFLLQTWQAAQSNLSINGLDVTNNPIHRSATLDTSLSEPQPSSSTDASASSPSKSAPPVEIEGLTFQYQPFDPRLQAKLASLHNELEKLTAEVSQLRRTAPRQGADRYTSSLKSVLEAEDSFHREKIEELSSQTQQGIGLGSERMKMRKGWNEDVKEVYERGVEDLDSLAGMDRSSKSENENDGRSGRRKRGPSMTETMGKVQRARTVALDMD